MPEAATAATTSAVTSWNCGLWSWLCTLTVAWWTVIGVLSGMEVVPGASRRLDHRPHRGDGVRRAEDAARRAGPVEAEAHHSLDVFGARYAGAAHHEDPGIDGLHGSDGVANEVRHDVAGRDAGRDEVRRLGEDDVRAEGGEPRRVGGGVGEDHRAEAALVGPDDGRADLLGRHPLLGMREE